MGLQRPFCWGREMVGVSMFLSEQRHHLASEADARMMMKIISSTIKPPPSFSKSASVSFSSVTIACAADRFPAFAKFASC